MLFNNKKNNFKVFVRETFYRVKNGEIGQTFPEITAKPRVVPNSSFLEETMLQQIGNKHFTETIPFLQLSENAPLFKIFQNFQFNFLGSVSLEELWV